MYYRYKERLLPKIIQSELYKIYDGTSDGKFIETFNNWLNNKHKEEYILVIDFIVLISIFVILLIYF